MGYIESVYTQWNLQWSTMYMQRKNLKKSNEKVNTQYNIVQTLIFSPVFAKLFFQICWLISNPYMKLHQKKSSRIRQRSWRSIDWLLMFYAQAAIFQLYWAMNMKRIMIRWTWSDEEMKNGMGLKDYRVNVFKLSLEKGQVGRFGQFSLL